MSLRAQAQATVLQIVQAQTQLAVEHPDLAVRDPNDVSALEDPRYIWFATNALLTADTIYALLGDDPEWRNTAAALIAQHVPFVVSQKFPCELFNANFLRFLREETLAVAAEQGKSVCPGR